MKHPDNFKALSIEINNTNQVVYKYYEQKGESFSIFKISGEIPDGSAGKEVGLYIYQKLALAILTHQPNAVLVDLSEFTYNYGTAIMAFLETFSTIRIFGEDDVLSAFILSDKNKYGIASLCNFNVENPRLPFFTDFEKGYTYLYTEYDKI